MYDKWSLVRTLLNQFQFACEFSEDGPTDFEYLWKDFRAAYAWDYNYEDRPDVLTEYDYEDINVPMEVCRPECNFCSMLKHF